MIELQYIRLYTLKSYSRFPANTFFIILPGPDDSFFSLQHSCSCYSVVNSTNLALASWTKLTRVCIRNKCYAISSTLVKVNVNLGVKPASHFTTNLSVSIVLLSSIFLLGSLNLIFVSLFTLFQLFLFFFSFYSARFFLLFLGNVLHFNRHSLRRASISSVYQYMPWPLLTGFFLGIDSLHISTKPVEKFFFCVLTASCSFRLSSFFRCHQLFSHFCVFFGFLSPISKWWSYCH